MRVVCLILALLVVSIWADAQTLPFRNTGDFYVADFGKDAIFRYRDLNGDGDVQDVGEQQIFYDDSSPGPDLGSPTAVAIHPVDGSVWISDISLDQVFRMVDKNGDGDANDAGEWKLFYDGKTGTVPFASAQSICWDDAGKVLYLGNAGAGTLPADFIARLEDKNNDGDAMDAGEAAKFLDNNAASGAWLYVPADLLYYKGELICVDNSVSSSTIPASILRIRDLNNDGDAMDKNEVTRFADPRVSLAGSGMVWNIAVDPGSGAIYGVRLTAYDVVRWQDKNNDGDALDAGEAVQFFDSTINKSGITLKSSFSMAVDSNGALYIANQSMDAVYWLRDLNSDLDANDAGEAGVYFDSRATPTPPIVLSSPRDCTFGGAAVIAQGVVRPTIGRTADWLIDDFAAGGLFYATAISLGKTGIRLPAPDIRKIPLAADDLMIITSKGLVPALTIGFQGVFPAGGQAQVKIAIPNHPALVNQTVHMAFLTLKASAPSGVFGVSRPYSFTIGK